MRVGRSHAGRRDHGAWLLPVLALAGLAGLVEALVRILKIPSFLLPAPSRIIAAAWHLGWPIVPNGAATLATILLGFAAAILVAVPLGILVATSRLASRTFYPLLVFTHAIPIVAVAPIIVVTFGTDMGARLIIVLLITFFPIMVATATGILDTPREMLELASAAGASRLMTIMTLRLPHAVPFVFGGLRIGMSVAVVGAVVGEFVSADRGLGYLVIQATSSFDIPLAMAAVMLLALMGVTLYQLVGLAHRTFFPWSVRSVAE